MSPKAAYVTLLTKTEYLPGALVLDYGLRSVGSRYPLVVMVTSSLEQNARDVLEKRGIPMVEVQTLQPEEGAHTLAAHDARFADTWTKLRYVNPHQFEIMNVNELVTSGVLNSSITKYSMSPDDSVTQCTKLRIAHRPSRFGYARREEHG
jgi:hypothetical protein